MRAGRLLSILMLLQARGGMTARQLAEELGVSLRTVYRDVEALSEAGVPVYADRGPAGGYRLVDGYRTRLTGMTSDEAESLFLTGMPGPAAELGLGGVLAGAERKLMAALPAELRERAGRVRERFHLDPTGWFRAADEVPHLAAVAGAVWEQREVEIRYERWKRPREVVRRVRPLGIVLKAGAWYLLALTGGEVRTYRVSKVLTAHVLDERFERPPGFDLAAAWSAWAARFEAGVLVGEAELRISPRGLMMLGFHFGERIAAAAQANAGPPDADGWVRTVIPTENINVAHHDMLRLGEDAEVLGPPELRERMAATARAYAARYLADRSVPAGP
ncbi:helix-turn-helix transcriptional regulator [Allonocardiopsis opalescens]|uniref:Putative DNA-binding transcriptional regulator YafY n=1 Tax=Allonocardiopsis opalescens TaxID=1144618 RepID=A0A2T0Q5K1_9ACTN|nr:WYL domain-containing protein [Allonocardiopsis opalescens]PRX99062.1 putative DNA-binding transcriptional regulator YafY [Allonocardiopsis opalescens]